MTGIGSLLTRSNLLPTLTGDLTTGRENNGVQDPAIQDGGVLNETPSLLPSGDRQLRQQRHSHQSQRQRLHLQNRTEASQPALAHPGFSGGIKSHQIAMVGSEPARDVSAAGKGGSNPFDASSKTAAQNTLLHVKPPAKHHPYVVYKDGIRSDLSKLGLQQSGDARVHVQDQELRHGSAVTRTIIGPTSLAQGAEASLTIGNPPDAIAKKRRPPEQLQRASTIRDRIAKKAQGELSSDQLVNLAGDELEDWLWLQGDTTAHIREKMPKDGKLTLANMSWGQSAERVLSGQAGAMLRAPQGSTAYNEVTKLLGHPPTLTKDANGNTQIDPKEYLRVRKELLDPKMAAKLQSPEHQQRMGAARKAFETELAAARKENLLVFAAGGNEYAWAEEVGRPEFSKAVASGTEGLILVGATDLKNPGKQDDTVAPFSAAGDISVSAPGVGLPVDAMPNSGAGQAELFDGQGTSFASPVALETAYLMHSVNPNLNADQIAKLIVDPRAVHDIAGTTRDGVGQLDPVRAALIAKNPGLTNAQLDHAQKILASDPTPTQLADLKRQLGLQ